MQMRKITEVNCLLETNHWNQAGLLLIEFSSVPPVLGQTAWAPCLPRPRPASAVIKDRCTNPVIEIMLQEFHEWGKKQNVESPRSPQQQAAQQSFKRRSPKITRRDGLVSIVFYSRLSLMIIAWLSQFHVYLPWGQHLFSWGLNRVIFENLRLKLYWPAAAAGQMGIVVVDNSGYISREW